MQCSFMRRCAQAHLELVGTWWELQPARPDVCKGSRTLTTTINAWLRNRRHGGMPELLLLYVMPPTAITPIQCELAVSHIPGSKQGVTAHNLDMFAKAQSVQNLDEIATHASLLHGCLWPSQMPTLTTDPKKVCLGRVMVVTGPRKSFDAASGAEAAAAQARATNGARRVPEPA
jgi:hypothetical protein